jgi:hypothetical protein
MASALRHGGRRCEPGDITVLDFVHRFNIHGIIGRIGYRVTASYRYCFHLQAAASAT